MEATYLAVPSLAGCPAPAVRADVFERPAGSDRYEIELTYADGAPINPVNFPWCQSVTIRP
jgi:hypothetical protein